MIMQKLIPPYLLIVSALLMICLHVFLPVVHFIHQPFNFSGFFFIACGLVVAKNIGRRFSNVNTEIHTFKNPRHLVTTGLFKYTRNPIYVGFVVVLIGFALLLGSVTSFLPVMLFFAVIHFWYIPFEEKALERQFGEEYRKYKKEVGRWFW